MIQIAVLILSTTASAWPFSGDQNDHAGRFHLVQLGTAMKDKYLLDSATGQVWEQVCGYAGQFKAGDCQWRKMAVEGKDSKPNVFDDAK